MIVSVGVDGEITHAIQRAFHVLHATTSGFVGQHQDASLAGVTMDDCYKGAMSGE